MKPCITLGLSQSTYCDVVSHLLACDESFVPRLSKRIAIADYAKKIVDYAIRIEAWSGSELIGLLAAYENNVSGDIAFITNVSVVPQWRGQKIASFLMNEGITHIAGRGANAIRLQVHDSNVPALHLYQTFGFVKDKKLDDHSMMILKLN